MAESPMAICIKITVRYWVPELLGGSVQSPPALCGRAVVGLEAGLSSVYFLSSSIPGAKDKTEWVFKPRSPEAEKSGPPAFYGRPVVGSAAESSGAYSLSPLIPGAKDKTEWVKPKKQEVEKDDPLAFYGCLVIGPAAGLSGTYLLSSSIPETKDKTEWVFKPRSQEAKKDGRALKSGIIWGTSAIKEVAAYMLDHDGFAGVPETRATVVNVKLAKSCMTDFGSLQRFIPHEGSCEEYGSSLFDSDNIHRIGLLDLRIANCDRHEGNLLVVKEEGHRRVVPIDHGYCLPNWRQLGDLYFCWSSWRQASIPFSESIKQYIAAQNPLADVMDLLDIGIDHDCAMTYILCALFVQRAVAEDLNLAQIANIMQRDIEQEDSDSSPFEKLISEAAQKSGISKFTGPLDLRLPFVGEFLRYFLLSLTKFVSAYSRL